MKESAESQMLSELMRAAKRLNMLDWQATQALYAKRDQAIADGLVGEEIKAHMLLVFIERWRTEVEPDMWRENTSHHFTVLDSEEVSAELFSIPKETSYPGSIPVPVTDDVVLQCLYDRSRDDMPTLVHFHDNTESIAEYATSGYLDSIRKSIGNINVLVIGYRGYCGSTGRARLFRMLRDGPKALDRLDIDPANCVVSCKGLGSIYGLELLRNCPKVAGIVIDGGIANVVKFLFQKASPALDAFLADRTENLGLIIGMYLHQVSKLEQYRGRVLVTDAATIDNCGADDAVRLYQGASTENKELRLYDHGLNNEHFLANQLDLFRAMRRLFAKAFPDKIEPPGDLSNDEVGQVQVRTPRQDA